VPLIEVAEEATEIQDGGYIYILYFFLEIILFGLGILIEILLAESYS
jgi:hypothetical protein